jgi:hypothetical protein
MTAGYLGLLFQQVKRPNAVLKLAGHFAGASMGETFAYKEATSREFPVGAFYALPAPSQPSVLEGANAPAATNQVLSQATNVIQLFQETVSVTYLAESDKTISGVVPIPQGDAGGQNQVQNPRSMEFQIRARLQKIAQDANYSFLQGVFANPANPAANALGTRGLLTAVSSNVNDVSAGAALNAQTYRAAIDGLLSQMITKNGYGIDETFVVFAGPTEFINIAHAYGNLGVVYLQPDQTLAGLQTRKLLSTFGTMLLTLEPDMPNSQLLIAKMDEVGIVGLNVPGKGVIFEESLYKQGSADQTQIYSQMGIDHGPEYYHGLLKVPAGTSIPL